VVDEKGARSLMMLAIVGDEDDWVSRGGRLGKSSGEDREDGFGSCDWF
jgi:hypothetical protein